MVHLTISLSRLISTLAAVGIATVGIAELWQRWESQSCDGSGWDLGTWEEEKSCHPILRKKK
jgi:hypothetical protein